MKEVFRFRSNDTIHDIYTVKWLPDTAPKAIIQIVHGMNEHMGRYEDLAAFLNDHDILVVGSDQLGHGRTASEGDKGFFCSKDPCRVLLEDIHKLRSLMQEGYPDVPYFILGHSMGSYLLRAYLTDHSEGLAGALILGTGYNAPIVTGFGIGLTKALSKIHGDHGRSHIIEAIVFGNKAYRQFDLSGEDYSNSWLCKDPDVVADFYSDELCDFQFTLNGYLGLFQAVKTACTQNLVDQVRTDLPILIASGTDDPVGDMGAGVQKTRDLFLNAGLTDVTMKLYEGDRHELFRELDKDKVNDDLVTWIESKI